MLSSLGLATCQPLLKTTLKFAWWIQIKLFDGEAVPKPTLLEKYSSCWNGEF